MSLNLVEPPEMAASASSSFYITGGTLPPEASSYVTRQADADLLEGLRAGEYCYVLNSRQMGKSSLCVRTIGRLQQAGVKTAFVDLTKFGGKNLSAEQWYAGLLSEMGRELGLRAEFLACWKEQAALGLGPLQRLFTALQEVALNRIETPIVVFVDEIDVTRSLPFSTDEFFAAIRQLYVGRATNPALKRLSFCLLGTATPAELIQDTRVSPFNIGKRIALQDFTPHEAAPLAEGLNHGEHGGHGAEKRERVNHGGHRAHGEQLLQRALYWTNGHPYLTQRLCRAAQESGAQTTRDIDRLCSELFLTHTAQESDDNLAFVRNRLLKSEVELAGLLDLYAHVWASGRVRDDDTNPLCGILKLSGVAKAKNGRLQTRNRIYAQVFNRQWVTSHMPDAELRRQKAAFRRGLVFAGALAGVVFVLIGALAGVALNKAKLAAANERRANDNAKQASINLRQANINEKRAESNEIKAVQNAKQAQLNADDAKQQTKLAKNSEINAKLSEKNAQIAQTLAQDEKVHADALRIQADNALGNAKRQKRVAEQSQISEHRQRREMEELRYASDMQLAAQAWQENNAPKVTTLLDAHLPLQSDSRELSKGGSKTNGRITRGNANTRVAENTANGAADSQDLRDFVWRYQWGLLHNAAVIQNVPDSTPLLGAITPDGKLLSINAQSRWTLWNPQTRREEQARRLPSVGFQSICLFSPDGKLLAMRDNAGRLALLDAQTLKPLWELAANSEAIRWWAFAPNSRWLAVLGNRGTAEVWDTTTGKSAHVTHGINQIEFSCLALAPDGDTLVMGGCPDSRAITAYNITQSAPTYIQQWNLSAQSPTMTTVACSSDGRWIACGDWGGRIAVWDTRNKSVTPALPYMVRTLHARINTLTFSPDSRTLAVAGRDNLTRLWNIEQQRVTRTLAGHTAPVVFVAWNTNGTTLATGSEDGTMRLWPVQSAPEPRALPFSTVATNRTVFSPDGRLLAVIDNKDGVVVWSVAEARVFQQWQLPGCRAQSLAFTHDGRTLAVGASDFNVHLWEVAGGRETDVLPGFADMFPSADYGVCEMDISHNGRYLAAALGKPFNIGGAQGGVKVWDMRTHRLVAALPGYRASVNALRFSPDSSLLATGGQDNLVRLWQTGDWQRPRLTFYGPDSIGMAYVFSLAFAPNSRQIAVGGISGQIMLHDARTGSAQKHLVGHSGAIRGLNYAPDGRTLASASSDHTIKVWEVATGSDVRTFTSGEDGPEMHSVTFSPVGDMLAASGGDAHVSLWEAPLLPAIAPYVSAEQRRNAQIQVHLNSERERARQQANSETVAASRTGSAQAVREILLKPYPPESETTLRSGPSLERTRIRFHNQTASQLKVFWIDGEGKRHFYGNIRPRADYMMGGTFISHVWLVTDMQEKPLALYVAVAKPGVANIFASLGNFQSVSPSAMPTQQTDRAAPIVQQADGAITLQAAAATIAGTGAKLEAMGGQPNIGFWTNPQDTVAWTFTVTRPGVFAARVIYASEPEVGGDYRIQVGNQSVRGHATGTGAWNRYVPVVLGRIRLEKPGTYTLVVQPTPDGWRAINLAEVALEPVK